MKKILAGKVSVYLFLLTGLFTSFAQADEIIIGTGTDSWQFPLYTYYHDARTQVIYLASEIGAPCTINSLAIDVTGLPGQTMNYFTIRIKHTDLNEYSTPYTWESTDWTVVYQAHQDITTTGWTQFVFTTPFEYNGSQNIIVDISFNNSHWTSSGTSRYSFPGGTRTLYYYIDSGAGDPLTWSGTWPTPTGVGYVPNIKLEVENANKTASPIFTPGAGSYHSELFVLVTCATPGAVMHYTINGVEPTESDPVIPAGFSIEVNSSLTLKAKAWKDGLEPSNTRTATYLLSATEPYFSPSCGTYDSEQNVTIGCATPGAIIRYTTDGSDPDENSSIFESGSSIAVNNTTTIKAKAWKGLLSPSGISTATYQLKVTMPYFSPYEGIYNSEQNVTITCPTQGAVIHYTTNGVEPTESDPVIASGSSVTVNTSFTLSAKAWKTNFEPSDTAAASYALMPVEPIFNPAGGIFETDPDVIITCETEGVKIHYTLNGNDPSENDSFVLSGESVHINISLPVTLKARALKPNFDGSYVTEAVYRKAQIIYVSTTGNNENDGFSWQTAKASVTTAYDMAQSGDQIWVAAGAYAGGFAIKAGVKIYGGFAGNETALSQRNFKTNVTTIGGGIHTQEYGERPDRDTVIDGFTITGGNACYGGGIFIYNASPTISNNIITENTAASYDTYSCSMSGFYFDRYGCGGGIFCYDSSPLIMNNVISNNTANFQNGIQQIGSDYWGGLGGGIFCHGGYPVIIGNTITNNIAGGAFWEEFEEFCHEVEICDPDCHMEWICEPGTFSRSNPGCGGGIYTSGEGYVANNVLSENKARQSWGYGYSEDSGNGGGMFVENNNLSIFGCVFQGNAAGNGGGLFLNLGNGSTITNCTFAGNKAYTGGSVFSQGYSATINNFYNNIFAFNSVGLYLSNEGTSNFLYNCVNNEVIDGAYNWSTGNIIADPQFVHQPDLNANDFGDLRLLPSSPCIDAGDNSFVGLDEQDIDDDGNTNELMPIDIARKNRFFDEPAVADSGAGSAPIIDIGAYEYGNESDCLPYDFDCSNQIDFIDFAMFAEFWYAVGCDSSNSWCENRDFDQSGEVDFIDLAEIANRWLKKYNMPADLDGNEQINFIDFAMFADFWCAAGCESSNSWCENRDFNKSGDVDFIDLAEITNYWLEEN